MSQFFKETAHLKTDREKYSENWDHIFKKYKCNCHLYEECVCDICQEINQENEKLDALPDTSS